MSRGASKLIGVLAAALLAALVLAACGSGGDSTTTGTSTASQASARDRANDVEVGPLKVVGGGAKSYRGVPDGRAYVTSWGEEASGVELEEAAAAEHSYLVARVEEDWPKACSYVSGIMLQRLASYSKQRGCAKILAGVTKPGPGGSDYESSEVEAESLRANGVWAFLLYRAATAPYYMPMVEEEGTWKVNLVAPIAFYG